MEPPWDRGTKVCSNSPGHMTKMGAIPIYDKNLKKSSPEPKDFDDFEILYATLGARVLPSLFK